MKPPLETSLAYKYFVAYRLYDGQRFDEIVIPYRPVKRLQNQIRALLGREEQMKWCLAFIAVSMTLAAGSPYLFLALPVIAAGLASLVPLYAAVQPTHLGFSEKGMRLYWIRWFGDSSTGYLPWRRIESLTIKRRHGLAGYQMWLRFKVDDSGMSPSEKRRFFGMWNGGTSNEFSIAMDGVAIGDHRRRLHAVLKEYVPEGRTDPRLHDTLNPVRIDRYTTLWLDVLSGSRKRIREEELPPGCLLANGRYEVIDKIGSGGQGTAYLGRALPGALGKNSAECDVVLKEFCLPYYAGLSVVKRALDHIDAEAELLKRIAHPQIVRLLDLFVDDQRAYLVLQHVPGNSLKEHVERQGPMDEERVVELGIQMGEMLLHLHGQAPPVVHRDFTPENLILTPAGELVLIDFNVAQQLQSTATRTVVGKHSYIPPEQFRGKAVPQSDIYALGASLYYLLTGCEPEPIATAHPRKIKDTISKEMDELVAGTTAIDLDLRYQSAELVLEDLRMMVLRSLGRAGSS